MKEEYEIDLDIQKENAIMIRRNSVQGAHHTPHNIELFDGFTHMDLSTTGPLAHNSKGSTTGNSNTVSMIGNDTKEKHSAFLKNPEPDKQNNDSQHSYTKRLNMLINHTPKN